MPSQTTNAKIYQLEESIKSMLQGCAMDGDYCHRYFWSKIMQNFSELSGLYHDEIDSLNRRVLELDMELLFKDNPEP